MVTASNDDMVLAGQTDYSARCDRYWATPGADSGTAADTEELVEQLMRNCGSGRLLDVGSGAGMLVAALLRRGMDAHGLDAAATPVARAQARMPDRFTLGSALALPYPDLAFDVVTCIDCLQQLAPADVPQAMREIARVARRAILLRVPSAPASEWDLTLQDRGWWERRCFEAGLRKHPAYYELNAYETLNNESGATLILMEPVPVRALERFPLAWLQQERELHMDMLRESGSRSDAHVARYQLAARYVRPGDMVIDAACGMGYGVHLTHALTRCAQVTGIDGSAAAVAYAQANFGLEGVTDFREGFLPQCLADLPDASVDVVISFETLEHVEDPAALLAEFRRILTPGGRLVASVPHDWSDETGEDPNPFHLHVYDKARFLSELGQGFDLERLIAQTADKVKKPGTVNEWLPRPRSFVEIDVAEDGPLEAEWLLAIASKSPLGGEAVPYRERVFTAEEQVSAGHALAFARDYVNPWLVRALVSVGLRTENPGLRERWARETLARCPDASADEGAALCVLGYLLLQQERRDADLEQRMAAFARRDHASSPNALRWQVSISHVLGLLALARGERAAAREWLQRVLRLPVADYSATLLTKPAEAALLCGLLDLADGDAESARELWVKSFDTIVRRLGERLARHPAGLPPGFELREMASVLLLLARSLGAARLADPTDPRPVILQSELNADDTARASWLERQLASWQRSARGQEQAIAELRGYAEQLRRGNEWLEGQRKTWEGVAEERGRAGLALAEERDRAIAANVSLQTQLAAAHQAMAQGWLSRLTRLLRRDGSP